MRTQLPKYLGFLILATSLSGCNLVRFKGVESFNSATTPVKYSSSDPNREWKGDPYSYGGVANGSGGQNPKTAYGLGSDPNSPDPVNPAMDQPAKGVGQQPGEFHVDPGNGYGITNAPIAQPSPSDVNSLGSRNGR